MTAIIYNFADYLKPALDKIDLSYTDRESFVQKVKSELSFEDFLDFKEALYDYGLYNNLDEEIQDLVDAYWNIREIA